MRLCIPNFRFSIMYFYFLKFEIQHVITSTSTLWTVLVFSEIEMYVIEWMGKKEDTSDCDFRDKSKIKRECQGKLNMKNPRKHKGKPVT